jgi:hypothetical protein
MEAEDDKSLLNLRYQHFQVLAMLLAACFVYSLAVQYTLICCREKGTWRFQNFSQYRNKQSMFWNGVLGGNGDNVTASGRGNNSRIPEVGLAGKGNLSENGNS